MPKTKLTGDALAVKKLSIALKESGLVDHNMLELIKSGKLSDKKIEEHIKTFQRAMTPDPLPVKDEYVLGVVVDTDWKHILVIDKKRPAWQSGLLNGPGGGVNEGETPEHAMSRECFEETNLGIPDMQWVKVGKQGREAMIPYQDHSYLMHIFVVEIPLAQMRASKSTTDEEAICLPLNVEVIRRNGVPGFAGIIDQALTALATGSYFKIKDQPVIEDDE